MKNWTFFYPHGHPICGQKIVSTGQSAKMNLGLPRFPEFERDAGRRNK
jgi:hypothetical protein